MAGKKVLIITYYWPPSGGSGVQRWLKFVKYLSLLGWEPVVYTPESPSFTLQDESLLKDVPLSVEVIKLPIWEPYDAFSRFSRLVEKKEVHQSDFVVTGRMSLFRRFANWVRGNFFIPDARVFWVKPSVTFLQDFIRSNGIDKLITTGPPHSMHLIGLKLKKKNPSLKWIADFRDPWTEWDLLDTLSLTPLARKMHRRKEKEVLTLADRVVTIAPYHVHRLEVLSGRKVDLITNGFDEDDFADLVHRKTEKFTLRHIGNVDELRDPRPIMEALKEVCAKDPSMRQQLRMEFIGNVNSAFKKYIGEDEVLSGITYFIGHLPHSQLVKLYGQTDVQLLVLAYTAIAPGNLPGKFFEYLASGNPVLAIGPVMGDAAVVLGETKAGVIFERTAKEGIQQAILNFYGQWKLGTAGDRQTPMAYTRKHLALQLIRILESLETEPNKG